MDADSTRAVGLRALEAEAEFLVLHQLDLLAQVEAQVRAVHHTMRRIETLRAARLRVGPELSNGEREDVLRELGKELERIDAHVAVQHTSCVEMQEAVERMRERLKAMRQAIQYHQPHHLAKPPDSAPPDSADPGAA
jgi:chaperonin cofactor prefoldin